MTEALDRARYELKLRQGKGSRYDSAVAPAEELVWARRGTAYFGRLLNGLEDRELDVETNASVTRRMILASIGLEARLTAELVGWSRNPGGTRKPQYPRPTSEQFTQALSLPAHALRNLYAHTVVHLDVEWRDLNDRQWDQVVECNTAEVIEIRKTPVQRAFSLWMAAIDMRAGGRTSDVPKGLMQLLQESKMDPHRYGPTVKDRPAIFDFLS